MFKVIGVIVLGMLFFLLMMYLSRFSQPTSGMYTFRRLYEKSEVATKSNPLDKTHYYSYLLDERLKEIESLYHAKQPDLVLSSSFRYSATAGELTQTIIKNKQKASVTQTISQFETHKKKLQKLVSSKQEYEKRWLDDVINYLGMYENQLRKLDTN